jgi:hypothetical protein
MIFILLLSIFVFSSSLFSLLKIQENTFFKLIISGIGALSFLSISFSFSLFFNLSFPFYITFLTILNIASVIFLIRTGVKIPALRFKINKWSILLLFIILIQTILFWKGSKSWGEWDAWAIWNLHAKFLFYDNDWKNLFTNKLNWTHPDYPLMLPSLIALFWKGLGELNPIVPAAIAYATLISILCLLYASLKESRFNIIGLIAILLLIIDLRFTSLAIMQYADTLVSLFILITIILLSKKEGKPDAYFFLIGLFAVLPIWVKNEGNVFFLLTCVLIICQHYKQMRKILYYIMGVLPVLLLYVYFKMVYAPANDLVGALDNHTTQKLLSFDRYITIGKYFLTILYYQFQLLLILPFALLVACPRRLVSGIILILSGTLAAYLCVYVITPHDLTWHLSTSLDRLIQQIYPSVIYSSLFILSKYLLFSHKAELS